MNSVSFHTTPLPQERCGGNTSPFDSGILRSAYDGVQATVDVCRTYSYLPDTGALWPVVNVSPMCVSAAILIFYSRWKVVFTRDGMGQREAVPGPAEAFDITPWR